MFMLVVIIFLKEMRGIFVELVAKEYIMFWMSFAVSIHEWYPAIMEMDGSFVVVVVVVLAEGGGRGWFDSSFAQGDDGSG